MTPMHVALWVMCAGEWDLPSLAVMLGEGRMLHWILWEEDDEP